MTWRASVFDVLDSEDESEEAADEDEYDDSSIRNFTTSRLENNNAAEPIAAVARNSKLKAENSIEVEPTDVGKDGGSLINGNTNNGTATETNCSVPGIVVKEDNVKGIFVDNIQTSGTYSSREESLKREEEAGRLKFVCVLNDGDDEHMV